MKQIKTRIGLKYDTYAHWTARGTWDQTNGTFTPNSNAPEGNSYDAGFIPLKGEVIFYEIPTTNPNSDVSVTGIGKAQTPPAILFKVGDGVNFLKDLPWGSAIAADVYAWAKNQSLLGGTNSGGTWTFADPAQNPEYAQEQGEVSAFIKRETANIKVKVDQVTEQNFQNIYGVAYDSTNQTHVARIGKYQTSVSTDGGTTWTASGDPFAMDVTDYTAGNGIDITNNAISVKTKQNGYIQNTSTTDTTDPENPVVTDTGIDVVTTTVTYTPAQAAQGDDPATPANLAAAGDGVVTNQAIGQIKNYVDAKAGESVVTVEKQSTADDDFAATYVVKQNGVQVGAKINIPKDFLVKSAAVIDVVYSGGSYFDSNDTQFNRELSGSGLNGAGKYIDFVINTKADGDGTPESDTHLYLKVTDLVDVYTGNWTSGTDAAGNNSYVKIEVDDNNVVSAHVYTASLNSLGTRTYTFYRLLPDGYTTDPSITGSFTITDSDGHGSIIGLPSNFAADGTTDISAVDFSTGTRVIAAEGTNLIAGQIFKMDPNGVNVGCRIVGVSYSDDGLATAGDVKDYVDSHIAAATPNIEAGDAIDITTQGSTKTVDVKLDSSRNGLNIQGNAGSGLSITQNGLAIDDSLTFYLNCGGADTDLGVIVTSQSGPDNT